MRGIQYQRVCAWCAAPYLHPSPKARWCSDQCRFFEKVDVSGGDDACWPWMANTSRTPDGSGSFQIDGKVLLAHRVMFCFAAGIEIDPDIFVMHSCDNPPCCNPRHLNAGTNDDNMADMVAKGRGKSGDVRGEDHGMARLTEDNVRHILATRSQRNGAALARQYGVTTSMICRIRTGRAWTHISA